MAKTLTGWHRYSFNKRCQYYHQHTIVHSPPVSGFPTSVSLNQGLQGISMGGPWPLCPASDLRERLQSLAGFHAPAALPDEAGPCVVQGPSFHPEEEVQGHRETVNATRVHTKLLIERTCDYVFLCFLCKNSVTRMHTLSVIKENSHMHWA